MLEVNEGPDLHITKDISFFVMASDDAKVLGWGHDQRLVAITLPFNFFGSINLFTRDRVHDRLEGLLIVNSVHNQNSSEHEDDLPLYNLGLMVLRVEKSISLVFDLEGFHRPFAEVEEEAFVA